LTRGRIESPLERDVESLFLSPRTMVGEIDRLIEEGVDVDGPAAARGAFVRGGRIPVPARRGAIPA
jgi:hypothetical protein